MSNFMIPTSVLYKKLISGESVYESDPKMEDKVNELAKSTGYSKAELKKSISLFGYDWTKTNIGTKEKNKEGQ